MSKEVYGLSSIFFSDYPQIFEVLDKKCDVISLVVTEEVLNVISEHSPENYKNLELYKIKPERFSKFVNCPLSVNAYPLQH